MGKSLKFSVKICAVSLRTSLLDAAQCVGDPNQAFQKQHIRHAFVLVVS
jgi:hypothetical protein